MKNAKEDDGRTPRRAHPASNFAGRGDLRYYAHKG